MGILLYALSFYVGLFMGFFLKSWLAYRSSYSGVIHVTKGREKTVYSLELNDYPDEIAFKKEIVFKVDTTEAEQIFSPEKSPDRK